MRDEDLVPGQFYWVLITLDPDGDDWENEPMPARYMGGGLWRYLGVDGDSDWPVRRVDGVLTPP